MNVINILHIQNLNKFLIHKIFMNIRKRNGELVKYEPTKISEAIMKAFVATNVEIQKSDIELMVNMICVHDGMQVEQIQDSVEKILMESYPEVAKAYIIYRYKRAEMRNIESKIEYIKSYTQEENAATSSKYDANANVESKNIATLATEINKGDNIKLNRNILKNKIAKMYNSELADEYIRQLESHEIYKHDETSIMPYCASVNMYQFLITGMNGLGGQANAPKNLRSFSGGFINLVFALASQFAGAIATPEFLLYMDYFIRKEYGDDYYIHDDEIVYKNKNSDRSIKKVIIDHFQQIVYSLNQPAAARGYQSVFWNVSYFDKLYFDAMFKDFVFPDEQLTKPQWESVNYLQRLFMKWFNEERTKTILTFPVETAALLSNKDGSFKDKEFSDFVAEMYSEGHSFFTYISNNPDSLSSCCRLRNEIQDNQFSYSLGAGGIATGSKSVMTINLNRLIQNAYNNGIELETYLTEQILKIHKYQLAYNEIIKDYNKAGILTAYSAGFIHPDKQYLTIGITGFVEGAEFLMSKHDDEFNIKTIGPDDEGYKKYAKLILNTIMQLNKKAKRKDAMFNTEYIPGENVGPKMSAWDKRDGYYVLRDSYNSYFYQVESNELNIIDKFKLHGNDFVQYLDGGSALHQNLEEHLSKSQYKQLLKTAALLGTNYFTFNIPNTVCNKCNHISKHKLKKCTKCGSEDLDYLTRVIGYLKRVSSFSKPRQIEENKRFYHNNKL